MIFGFRLPTVINGISSYKQIPRHLHPFSQWNHLVSGNFDISGPVESLRTSHKVNIAFILFIVTYINYFLVGLKVQQNYGRERPLLREILIAISYDLKQGELLSQN